MTIELLAALAAFAFISLITPGPNNLMLLASGMNYGWLRTIPHMLGIGIGFPVMIALVGLGIMQVFDLVPASYTVLKVLCAAYLCYLAWKIATAAPVQSDDSEGGTTPLTFFQAAAFQWVNPKAWAMGVTAISVYTPPDRSLTTVIVASLTFALIGIFSLNCWTLLGQQLRRLLQAPVARRVFNVGCALILVASLYPMIAWGFL